MKILLLSICGKLEEPEDLRYTNLYLVSLKKNVIPYVDTKVLLFSTSIETYQGSSLHSRVVELGLDGIVQVLGIGDMGLPEKSLLFLKSINWAERIGLNMNLLFDYSKSNNFFNCDWIFHTDTDIEFLENFSDRLNTVNLLKSMNDKVVITLSGDSYNFFIKNGSVEFLFEAPDRIDIYNEDSIYPNFNRYKVTVRDRPDILTYPSKILISPIQLKIRNDFVGMSIRFAESVSFNWVYYDYPDNLDLGNDVVEFIGLAERWKSITNLDIKLRLSADKGYSPMYKLQSGDLGDVVKVQLSVKSDMVSHFGSGWFNDSFLDESKSRIYTEYKDEWDIVAGDYS
jgi:hypothetical protein